MAESLRGTGRQEKRFPFWVRWGVPLAVVLAFRLPYFGLTVLNSDEGLYAAVARAMQLGGLPYRDAWDHAAPGIFYLYRGLFGIFGPWSMGAVRLAALAAHFASGMVVGAFIRRKHGDLAGTVAAVLTITALGGYLPADVIAALTETFLMPFLLAALCLMIPWVEGGKGRPLLTGVLIALATWFKIHALLLTLILMIGGMAARSGLGKRLSGSFAFPLKTLGWSALAYLLLVLPLWIAGGLYDYLTIYIGYNIFYFHAGKYDLSFFNGLLLTIWQWGFPQWLIAVLAATGLAALFSMKGGGARARGVFLAFGVAGGALTGIAGARLFGHYFLPAAGITAICAAEGAAFLIGRVRELNSTARLPIIIAGAGVLLAGVLQPLVFFHGDAYKARVQLATRGGTLRPKFYDLTREIDRLTRPEEKIWVWGFAPEIYTLARRDCASRFINDNYLVGLVPWVNAAPGVDTTPFIVPGSWGLLQQDLTSNPPAAIIDAAEAGYQFWGKYPLAGNPALERFVKEHYRYLGAFDRFGLYLRKDLAIREGLDVTGEEESPPEEQEASPIQEQETMPRGSDDN